MTKINSYIPEKYLHTVFYIGVLLKALNGVIEIIGGIFLLYIGPYRIVQWVWHLTNYEISRDPGDRIANYLIAASHQLSSSSKLFIALYLLSHGVIKIFIIWGLLKKKLWAYPFGILVFTAFGVYQMYRYVFTHETSLIVLTVLDVIVIALTWHEYNYLKND